MYAVSMHKQAPNCERSRDSLCVCRIMILLSSYTRECQPGVVFHGLQPPFTITNFWSALNHASQG